MQEQDELVFSGGVIELSRRRPVRAVGIVGVVGRADVIGVHFLWSPFLGRFDALHYIHDSRNGKGRWGYTREHAANLVIFYRGQTCWYDATFMDRDRMNWVIRNAVPGSVPSLCMSGNFGRVKGPDQPAPESNESGGMPGDR